MDFRQTSDKFSWSNSDEKLTTVKQNRIHVLSLSLGLMDEEFQPMISGYYVLTVTQQL